MKDAVWIKSLANMVTEPAELFSLLAIPETDLLDFVDFKKFPLRVTREYIAKMKKGDINDPLLKQILPVSKELALHPEYSLDPLQELQANPIPGLLHKYYGRILITLTGACAIHCRYCFRRHFPYAENTPGKKGWQKMLAYIESHPEIHEVILSGGDPLIMNDHTLNLFLEDLSAISHVETVRLHSRLPIVLPSRITSEFIVMLKKHRFKFVMVIHANHPNEIDIDVKSACDLLREASITLLNQSVILKDINDSGDILISLSHQLFSCGVLPYYLHLLDKVQGAQHFDVSKKLAKELHAKMKAKLPGYLVPKLVFEQASECSKTWI